MCKHSSKQPDINGNLDFRLTCDCVSLVLGGGGGGGCEEKHLRKDCVAKLQLPTVDS